MRSWYAAFGAICLVCVPGVAVAAPVPAAGASLLPGEVLLQISARGTVHTPADSVTITVPITTSSDSAAAARVANQAIIDRLKKSLTSQGIDPKAITMLPLRSARMGFIGNAAFDPDDSAPPKSIAGLIKRKIAQSILQITLTDATRVKLVDDVLDAENQGQQGGPIFALKDDTAARRAATGDAIAKARAEAESYARPLGMQVARIVRISNQGDTANNPDDFVQLLQTVQGAGSTEVTTTRQISVDFILAPR